MERDRRRYYPEDSDRRRYSDEPERRRYSEDSDRRRYADDPDRRYRQDGDDRRRNGRNRRRKKKRSALSGSLTYILVVCAVSAILAGIGWTLANDVLALNKDEVTASIVISDEKNFNSVADQLKKTGIIKYKTAFKLFAAVSGGEDKISAGTYVLNTDMDYRAILNNLGSSSASRASATVTIPEGYSMDQIFKLLEESGVSTVEKLEDMAANHNYAFSFLQEIPLGDPHRLEGYLFPDTYIFYMGEDPKYVLNKMLVNFDAKVTDAMRQQIWDKGYSIGQVLTIASMIEKETDGTDRTTIASVIYNRLNNPSGATAGFLQIDATIQYVLPEGEIVTEKDYQTVQSPYNTYLNKGLPPGPISNPGLESIVAAINPEKSNYFFYALGDDDRHHFFSSYSEHQAFLNS